MKFGNIEILKDISIKIYEGEIVGLVGENGAGKSTLLKIIMGIYPPSSGKIWIKRKEYIPKNPKVANKSGVGMVFQDLSLIKNLTVGQNIFFGNEQKFKKCGFVIWKRMYEETVSILKEFGLEYIKPNKKVSELDIISCQMVEIVKIFAFAKNFKQKNFLILLDEPTSRLNDKEIKILFYELRKIRAKGNSIIFVSHRLNEVIEICERIYVLKDGEKVGTLENQKDRVNEGEIYKMMVGKSSSHQYYKVKKQTEPGEKVILEAKKLKLNGKFDDVSFKLHEREIIGICGVVGSGKEELCNVIAGSTMPTSGELLIEGKKFNFNSPHDSLKAGIISIPMDVREEGTIGALSICDNITLSSLDNFLERGFISIKKQIEASRYWINKLQIKCSSYNQEAFELSGGNAQKVSFARILAFNPKILVLNYPTRGVDIGAKEEIYEFIREIILKKKISIILLGDTLDESIGLSNRILIMKDGLVTKEINTPIDDKPRKIDIIKYMM